MRPDVDGIADKLWQKTAEPVKFRIRVGVACDLIFGNSFAAKEPPLIMIARKTDLRIIIEAFIFEYILRRQMTMIIKNRDIFYVIGIQISRCVVIEKIIVIQKHTESPRLLSQSDGQSEVPFERKTDSGSGMMTPLDPPAT